MKVTPLYDRVIVKRKETANMTKGGLHIPENAKEKPLEGTIIAIGTGLKKEDGSLTPLIVKKGDTILFSQYAGSDIVIDGEELLIMKEVDILGIVE
jgi:chaperonin GroES